ncbi:MAG: ATP-grasp domain-containing protein [Candidatus Eisenbacteria bacterium]|uniref:ATP-grasp domain-containing protein n=1 Tax=Eiseniibacteriota bacterium TaxID=2212470 RepID=A0A956LXP3_UNCEI|nr:ATP-grasp domain-containing protein [Candidatus Eisenbacteria bacterium]
MRILFLSPSFPAEMPLFVHALAESGVQVVGVGDVAEATLPEPLRASLSGYVQVGMGHEHELIAAVRRYAQEHPLDRVECLWEPGVMLAAKLRAALGLPGLDEERTLAFRDKGRMKAKLEEAGLAVPRHRRTRTERGVREATEEFGFPVVLKPIAGAGSLDTHRVDDAGELEHALRQLRHVDEVSVEEYVDGEEYTFDTICYEGKILFQNISWYRPKPIVARNVQWISPQTVGLRVIDGPDLASGRALGESVLQALEFDTGFTHMEWFRRPDGTAVFCEIGCRPPGARSVDVMNQVTERDLYRAWAEAVHTGTIAEPIQRRQNAAVIFKRARGEGRISRVEGLDRLLSELGPHLVGVDLLPVGAHRRNWKQTLLSDGWLTVRHPDLPTLLEMADRVGTDLQLFAE